MTLTPSEIRETLDYIKRLRMPRELMAVYAALVERQRGLLATGKLSDDDKRTIVELHNGGMGYKTIAKKFNLSPSYIRDICKGAQRVH